MGGEGSLAASRLARAAKVRWAETLVLTNGEPRWRSDQEPAAFIGCGSQVAPPSCPRRRAGRGLRGAGGGTLASPARGAGRCRPPLGGGARLRPPLLLRRWRLLERCVERSRVGLPLKGCGGAPRGPGPRIPAPAGEDGKLVLTFASCVTPCPQGREMPLFIFQGALCKFEFHSSPGRG